MNKKQILAAAVVAALSTGMGVSGVGSVLAADAAPAASAPAAATAAQSAAAQPEAGDNASEQATEKELIKVSEDAAITMHNVRGARLSIFNGQPGQALTYVDAAVARAAAAVADAEKYAVDANVPEKDDAYVPYDASLTVLDTFEPSKAKLQHIAKANEHLHRGEKQEAMEVLKLGEVDVAVTARLVPVKLAKKHIDAAAKLVGEGKYYEANLVLKSVEDATIIETFAIDAVPKAQVKS